MTTGNISADAKALFSHIDNSISKRIQIINPKSSRHVKIHGAKEPLPDILKNQHLIEELLYNGYLALVGDHIYEIPEDLRGTTP